MRMSDASAELHCDLLETCGYISVLNLNKNTTYKEITISWQP